MDFKEARWRWSTAIDASSGASRGDAIGTVKWTEQPELIGKCLGDFRNFVEIERPALWSLAGEGLQSFYPKQALTWKAGRWKLRGGKGEMVETELSIKGIGFAMLRYLEFSEPRMITDVALLLFFVTNEHQSQYLGLSNGDIIRYEEDSN